MLQLRKLGSLSSSASARERQAPAVKVSFLSFSACGWYGEVGGSGNRFSGTGVLTKLLSKPDMGALEVASEYCEAEDFVGQKGLV